MHIKPVIAIDGPSASGKTTVGLAVAKAIQIPFMDTGTMYRFVTAIALLNGSLDINGTGRFNPEELAQISDLVTTHYITTDNEFKLLFDGGIVKANITAEEVNKLVPTVAAISSVREKLVNIQRKAVAKNGIVMVGRDIGTCVLPNANVKIYITASLATRAQRRSQQLKEEFDSVMALMQSRDSMDSSRATSPMRPASDAITINTDNLSVAQITQKIINLVNCK